MCTDVQFAHAPCTRHLKNEVISCEGVLRVHPDMFCKIEVEEDDTAIGKLRDIPGLDVCTMRERDTERAGF